jgi:hypothetical protein
MTSRTYNTMTVLVSQSTTQDIFTKDSVANAKSDDTFCGTRSYSMSLSNSFLSISGNTLTLSPSAVTDAATYNMNITVGLVSYPTVATITLPITLVITC